jgi:hypothetical protein
MAHRYLSIGIYWIDLGCRQVPGLHKSEQIFAGDTIVEVQHCFLCELLNIPASSVPKIAYLLKITFSTVPWKFLKLDQVD